MLGLLHEDDIVRCLLSENLHTCRPGGHLFHLYFISFIFEIIIFVGRYLSSMWRTILQRWSQKASAKHLVVGQTVMRSISLNKITANPI